MSKEIKIIPDWYEKFWDAMEKLYPNAVYIPEICDAYEYLAENVIQPLIDERAIFINRMNKDELKALLLSWYNNDIEFKDVLVAIEEAQLLPNLSKSTENLSKIKDKDEWLKEVRGEESLTNEQVIRLAKDIKSILINNRYAVYDIEKLTNEIVCYIIKATDPLFGTTNTGANTVSEG